MTISLAQFATLTCPECGTPFAAEVWLIVTADERPDLIDRICTGNVHISATITESSSVSHYRSWALGSARDRWCF
jgi:hypothetical protein